MLNLIVSLDHVKNLTIAFTIELYENQCEALDKDVSDSLTFCYHNYFSDIPFFFSVCLCSSQDCPFRTREGLIFVNEQNYTLSDGDTINFLVRMTSYYNYLLFPLV